MEDVSPARKERGNEAIYALIGVLSSIAAAETVQDERSSETRGLIIVQC